jgi:diadenosine tetraphosphate (Ap4A) HIT family hydrolase
MTQAPCPYCYEATPPKEQFYETKLFRVVVARAALAEGHVVMIPKRHDPHFYGLSLDELEEFGYLVKKVSFWAMRLTRTVGFTLLMNDGSSEVQSNDHLEIHIIPRGGESDQFGPALHHAQEQATHLSDEQIDGMVKELQNLMQMPQAV